MRRTVLISLALLAAGCASDPDGGPPDLVPPPEVATRADALSALAEREWHLPLRVRVRGERQDGVAPASSLLVGQVAACEEAYRRSPFDAFAIDLVVDPGLKQARAHLVPDPPRLVVELGGGCPGPLGADALLEAWAEGYRWERKAPWQRGVSAELLREALRRDLGKLRELELELAGLARRLDLLAGSVRARARQNDEEVVLTPSEARFARHTWWRATFALYRVVNTVARWRPLAEAGQGEVALLEAASTAALFGRHTFSAYLGWLLETVVGGRSLAKLWRHDFWSRNPIYKLLDSEAPLLSDDPDTDGRPGPAGVEHLPQGSVAALLELRLDGGVFAWIDDLPLAAPDAHLQAKVGSDHLSRAIMELRELVPGLRRLEEDRGLSGFRAWKELWDARLKNTLRFPLYHAVAGVSRFLGHTRLSGRAPAISSAQLALIAGKLEPGDVLLAREDGFLSNAFLPGFWPHAILYLGPEERWADLRLPDGTRLQDDPVVQRALPRYRALTEDGHAARVIEAVSKGVIFSSFEHAVQKDYAVAFRPDVSEGDRATAIRRALALLGRPYDFDFDFQSDDKIVCTELVYRAYDDRLNFRVGISAPDRTPAAQVPGVIEVLGRQTMPANEVARYALYMVDHPQPQESWRYPGRKLSLLWIADRLGDGAVVLDGAEGLARLRQTVTR
ncbi:MAG: YiiX/YebB-like N1pC/P60 family cysteine hydrolase [Planctomycetota bacterium]